MIGRAPSSTMSMAACPNPWKMKVPSPPAPIRAATAVRPMAWTVVMRTPSSTTGSASGRRTCKKTWRRAMPMPRADSITAGSTSSRATKMLRTIGSRL